MSGTSYGVLICLVVLVVVVGVAFQLGAGPVLAKYSARHRLLSNHPINQGDDYE